MVRVRVVGVLVGSGISGGQSQSMPGKEVA